MNDTKTRDPTNTIPWETYVAQQEDAATTACREHRRRYHLSTQGVDAIPCETGCLAWTTCPLVRPLRQRVIDRFFGDYIFLSNFYLHPVHYAGETYPSVEHAFQAAKTLNLAWRERIRRAPMPKDAKRLGHRVPLRPDWEQHKVAAMSTLVQAKFADPLLVAKLQSTGDALLVEGNTWGDRFWGVDRRTGLGLNHLGRILMAVREAQRRLS